MRFLQEILRFTPACLSGRTRIVTPIMPVLVQFERAWHQRSGISNTDPFSA